MATLSLLATRPFCPSSFTLERVSGGFTSRSQVSALLQVRPTLGWYWRGSMRFPAATHADRAEMEALMHAWGLGDVMSFGHPLRPVPRGTMRGSPTVSGAHSAGSRVLKIDGTGTLEAGDLFKAGGCLYMVAEKATLSGPTDVILSGSLLTDLSSGAPIEWDRPAIDWVRTSPIRVTYIPGISVAIEVDFEEAR